MTDYDEYGNPVDENPAGLTADQIDDLTWSGDYENVEFEKRMDGYMKRKAKEQIKFSQQAGSKKMQEIWKESLDEAGLSQQEYDQLFMQDPEHGVEALKQTQKQLAKAIAARKGKPSRDQRGQFKSGPQSTQQPRAQSNEKIEAAKEVIKKRALSSEEELNILEAVLKG